MFYFCSQLKAFLYNNSSVLFIIYCHSNQYSGFVNHLDNQCLDFLKDKTSFHDGIDKAYIAIVLYSTINNWQYKSISQLSINSSSNYSELNKLFLQNRIAHLYKTVKLQAIKLNLDQIRAYSEAYINQAPQQGLHILMSHAHSTPHNDHLHTLSPSDLGQMQITREEDWYLLDQRAEVIVLIVLNTNKT